MSIASTVHRPEGLEAAITRAIAEEVERLREAAIQEAVTDFECRLRDGVSRAALRLSDHYSIERDARNLVITVRINPNPHTP